MATISRVQANVAGIYLVFTSHLGIMFSNEQVAALNFSGSAEISVSYRSTWLLEPNRGKNHDEKFTKNPLRRRQSLIWMTVDVSNDRRKVKLLSSPSQEFSSRLVYSLVILTLIQFTLVVMLINIHRFLLHPHLWDLIFHICLK